MTQPHDPSRQVNYLQQCLSSDKRPLGLFLGAGCPVATKSADGSPLIPDIAGMTTEVQGRLRSSKDLAPLLLVVEGHFATDGYTESNIEDMLSHIRGLRLVAGKGTARGLTAKALDQLDKGICDVVTDLATKSLPHAETPYHNAALWTDAVSREYPVELFTTNYDLLLEQALEDCRVAYFDGFAGVRRPFFDIRAMEEDTLPPRWARVWKLHGSLNWYHDPERGVLRGAQSEGGLKRVIHPSHLKYEESRRMPYLAMIDRLRAFLRQPSSALVIAGYSFRDEHLNEVVMQGLQGTPSAAAFGLLFGTLAKYPDAVRLASQRPNLSLLARDGGIIGGVRSMWLQKEPGLIAGSDSPWISWIASDVDKNGGERRADFKLGDFAVLGSFLRSLVGSIGQALDAESAS